MQLPAVTGPDRELRAFQQALAGCYSIERELGRGGMGIVYLARELALDRRVALKLLPPARAADPAVRASFLREARTAARLSHPHIVPIHTVASIDGFVFFAMACVDGETLGQRVRRAGPLRERDAARILREIAWALAYAHAEGVIHRDVKPDNILLENGTGRALLTDFGIAAAAAAPGPPTSGEVQGTAEFMSPEQAVGRPAGAAGDLYALGVVGFFALSGRVPFEAASTAEVLARHIHEPPPPLVLAAPGTSPHLAGVIARCLRKAPDDRFPDGATLADALSHDVRAQPELPVPLRAYIARTRDLASAAPLIVLLWSVTALVPVLANVRAWPVPILAILCTPFVAPFAALVLHARQLLAAGYGIEDARLAIERDVDQRLEQIRYEYGSGPTLVDRALRLLAAGGFATGLGALGASLLGFSGGLTQTAFLGGVNLGVASLFGIAFRNKRRRDVIGETVRAVLGSRFGRWLFGAGGLGLKPDAAAAESAHRPTERVIGLAADQLYEGLPGPLKRELAGLPDVVRRLEAGATRLRRQLAELGALLERADTPAAVERAEERARVVAGLEARRDAAMPRLTETVTALETIRLGLLRLHAGEAIAPTLTHELGAADALATGIGRLIAAQADVRLLLDERSERRSGVPSRTTTPPAVAPSPT